MKPRNPLEQIIDDDGEGFVEFDPTLLGELEEAPPEFGLEADEVMFVIDELHIR